MSKSALWPATILSLTLVALLIFALICAVERASDSFLSSLFKQTIACGTKKEICSRWKFSFNDAETKLFLNLKYRRHQMPFNFSFLTISHYSLPNPSTLNHRIFERNSKTNLRCICSLLATGKITFFSDCEFPPPEREVEIATCRM